jgi:hypothetical protein
MADLPVIDASALTRAQRDGRACVSCRKRFPRPTVPVGRLVTGQVLYRCPECLVELEPTGSGPDSLLSAQPQSNRRR